MNAYVVDIDRGHGKTGAEFVVVAENFGQVMDYLSSEDKTYDYVTSIKIREVQDADNVVLLGEDEGRQL